MRRNGRHLVSLVCVLVILAALVLACRCGAQPVAPTVTPVTPTARPTPLPPVSPQVIQMSPARGEEQLLDAPVQLVFDQPMDTDAVEAAFTIEPAVAGDLEWVTARMVQFKPAGKGFERATRYTISLKEVARSEAGLALRTPVQFHFDTVGFLEVTAVQPVEESWQPLFLVIRRHHDAEVRRLRGRCLCHALQPSPAPIRRRQRVGRLP